MTFTAPNDNLFRGRFDDRALVARADDADTDGTTMFGHFSAFDTFYEIDSWYEGRFLERVAKGSFRKTIRENRDSVKVAFDHGYDFLIGDKPLGPIEVLREDDIGPYYEVPLLDTDYNREQMLPLLAGRLMNGDTAGSQLGASFRFRVTREDWNQEPKASDLNPDRLPERTIREVRLFEFGPVVYPANDAATAGVRSLTDRYEELRLSRQGLAARAARRLTEIAEGASADVVVTDAPRAAAPLSEHPAEPSGLPVQVAIRQLLALK